MPIKPQGQYLSTDEALLTVTLNLLEEDRKTNWSSVSLLPSCCPWSLPSRGITCCSCCAFREGCTILLWVLPPRQRFITKVLIPRWRHTVLRCCVWRFEGWVRLPEHYSFFILNPYSLALPTDSLCTRTCLIACFPLPQDHLSSFNAVIQAAAAEIYTLGKWGESARKQILPCGPWVYFQPSHTFLDNLEQVTTTCAPADDNICITLKRLILSIWLWNRKSLMDFSTVPERKGRERRKKKNISCWACSSLLPTPMSLTDDCIPLVLTPVLPGWETAWQLGFWFTLPVKHENNSRKAYNGSVLNLSKRLTTELKGTLHLDKTQEITIHLQKCSCTDKTSAPAQFYFPL